MESLARLAIKMGVACQLLGVVSGPSGQDISGKAAEARIWRALIKIGNSHIYIPISLLNMSQKFS